MSHIIVQLGIEGEETLSGFESAITCRAMQHGIDMPVVSNIADRTEGASVHGSIVLEHEIDKSSPILREYCAKGTNIAEVTITRIKVLGGEPRPADVTKLKTAKIVSVSVDTPVDDQGQATDMPVETFALDYQEIKWEHKAYEHGVATDTIAGSYDTATLSTTVSIA
jgi:type VI secretion system Hcp family effector